MIAAIVLVAAVAVSGNECPAPDAARVAEIARHLPAMPAWAGDPFPSHVKKGERILKGPIPDCSDELYLLTTKTGDRDRYQRVYHRRVGLLAELAGTACAT